jgi:hypothetical protein
MDPKKQLPKATITDFARSLITEEVRPTISFYNLLTNVTSKLLQDLTLTATDICEGEGKKLLNAGFFAKSLQKLHLGHLLPQILAQDSPKTDNQTPPKSDSTSPSPPKNSRKRQRNDVSVDKKVEEMTSEEVYKLAVKKFEVKGKVDKWSESVRRKEEYLKEMGQKGLNDMAQELNRQVEREEVVEKRVEKTVEKVRKEKEMMREEEVDFE